MKLPSILLAAGLAALALPAVASADSIVYIDQGNVWSATPDGARKVQLTTGGGWHSPTQADDGTIAAVQGTGPIVVMARDGRPLRTITTPTAQAPATAGRSRRAPSSSPSRPTARRSPTPTSPTRARSPRPAARSSARLLHGRGRHEATPISVYGNQFSVSNPEWVTNSRTLVFGGYGSQVVDRRPRRRATTRRSRGWCPNGDMGDGEVTRDGKRLAVTSDYGPNKKLAFFAVTGDVDDRVPARVPRARRARTTNGDEQLRRPLVVARRLRASPTRAPPGIERHALHEVRRGRLRARRTTSSSARPAPSPTGARPTRRPPRYTPPVVTPDAGTARPTRRSRPHQARRREARRRQGDGEGAAQGPRRQGRGPGRGPRHGDRDGRRPQGRERQREREEGRARSRSSSRRSRSRSRARLSPSS